MHTKFTFKLVFKNRKRLNFVLHSKLRRVRPSIQLLAIRDQLPIMKTNKLPSCEEFCKSNITTIFCDMKILINVIFFIRQYSYYNFSSFEWKLSSVDSIIFYILNILFKEWKLEIYHPQTLDEHLLDVTVLWITHPIQYVTKSCKKCVAKW